MYNTKERTHRSFKFTGIYVCRSNIIKTNYLIFCSYNTIKMVTSIKMSYLHKT